MNKKLKVFEAFAGYGSQSISLRDIGVNHEVVGISEIEPDAIIAYGSIRYNLDDLHTNKTHDEMREELIKKNIGKDFKTGKSKIPRMKKDKLEMLYKFDKAINNFGDVSLINPKDLPDFDYLTYSFPCTDISISGKQEGMIKNGTRSGLLYECEKIIEVKRPKYLLMENVKNLVGKKFRGQFNEWCEYLEDLGYTNYHNNYKCLNAKNFGVAQNRERIFMISILGEHEEYVFPQGEKLTKKLKDFLDKDVEEKYYLSEEIQKRFKQTKADDGSNNIIGTTAPEFRTIGQIDLVYGSESNSLGTLVATDYKQPKQIIDYSKLVGGFGEINFGKQYRQGNRVYDSEGIAMCLTAQPLGNTGGNSYLYKVDYLNGAIRGRYNENGDIEQQLELRDDGVTNTITSVQKDNVVVINERETFKYEPSGENVIGQMCGDLWERRHEQTRRVYDVETVSPTMPTCSGGGQHPKILEHNTVCEQRCDEGLRFFKDNICGTVRTIDAGGDKRIIETIPSFRIRKITPREALRLMGVSENDIDKMQSVGLSDSSLYKLAGNSIVKQVLDALHKNMFLNTNDITPREE